MAWKRKEAAAVVDACDMASVRGYERIISLYIQYMRRGELCTSVQVHRLMTRPLNLNR